MPLKVKYRKPKNVINWSFIALYTLKTSFYITSSQYGTFGLAIFQYYKPMGKPFMEYYVFS